MNVCLVYECLSSIIGLSWGPSDGRNQSDDQGGICEYRRYFILNYENFNVRKLKSYNSAVISYKFFGKMAPPKVAELAFLRQVGRAFGAPVSTGSCYEFLQLGIEKGNNTQT